MSMLTRISSKAVARLIDIVYALLLILSVAKYYDKIAAVIVCFVVLGAFILFFEGLAGVALWERFNQNQEE
ncbi:hypothetical protein HY933_00265 [Candidatus Falkowbacteria bacterium]|nr:hypothetical protein [Candidatus Falkowbacteria bacterium]